MSSYRTCARNKLQLPWLLNGTLPPTERRQLREHLIGCPACRVEMAKARQALELFSAAAAPPFSTVSGEFRASPSVTAVNRVASRRGDFWAWATAAALLTFVASGALWQFREGSSPRAAQPRSEESRPASSGISHNAVPIFADGFDDGDTRKWTLKS